MAKLIVSNKYGQIVSQKNVLNSTIPKAVDSDPHEWSTIGKYSRHKPICTPAPRPKKIYATTIV